MNLFRKFNEWFESVMWVRDWEMEKYLAGATDAADLEHRMRKWEKEMGHRNKFFME